MKFNLNTTSDGLVIIQPKTTRHLKDFHNNEFIDLLKTYGVLLFRNFNTDTAIFSNFIEQHSARITIDPARNNTEKNTQLVDAGLEAVTLHVENGTTPFIPHCIWFYSEKAANRGSETTYCDGINVWNDLSKKTKSLFINNQIKYERTVPEHIWKRFLSAELKHHPIQEVSPEHLMAISDQIKGLSITLNPNMSASFSYTTSALQPTLSNEQSFANSLLGPSYNYELPKITLANGDFIPNEVWEELNSITEKHTKDITWEDHDIVVIDNTRFMHGRRKILDPNRTLHAAMSYLY